MKKLIKDLYLNRVPVNEGYDYVFTDDIYLPIFKSSLVVTKRTIIPLSLVEEMVLQLLNNEVYQIDEISNILGLNRRLLEITLADLYSRDLVEVSSDSCRLLALGRKALVDLNRSEKKQDILKDIVIDAIFGQVVDVSSYQIVDNARWNDNKMKAVIPLGKVENYIAHFKEISEIFEEENKLIFSDGMQPIKEELLTIDKVENTYVKFIKIPVHVYVSTNAMDVDVMSANIKTSDLFSLYKDVILEQINQKQILKNHFKFRKLNDNYSGDIYSKNEELYDELKKNYYKRNKKRTDYEKIEKFIFTSRKLFLGEYKVLLKYLLSKVEEPIVYVDNLENWAYDFAFCNLLQEVLEKKELTIFYDECRDKKKTINHLRRNYTHIKCVQNSNSGYYICWKIGQYKLYGIPIKREIINNSTICIVTEYYLEV